MMENVRQTVTDINNTLFEKSKLYEHDYFVYLEFVETPIGDYVKYMGNYLWDSENDYRQYDLDGNLPPLKDFLVAEIKKVQSVVKNCVAILEAIG